MESKHFLRAIQIPAPGDQFTPNSAKRFPGLPAFVADTALESQELKSSSNQETQRAGRMTELSMSHALRIKSAHYWLELGELDQALLELGALSTTASNHPLAVKARIAVLQALRKRNEATVHN